MEYSAEWAARHRRGSSLTPGANIEQASTSRPSFDCDGALNLSNLMQNLPNPLATSTAWHRTVPPVRTAEGRDANLAPGRFAKTSEDGAGSSLEAENAMLRSELEDRRQAQGSMLTRLSSQERAIQDLHNIVNALAREQRAQAQLRENDEVTAASGKASMAAGSSAQVQQAHAQWLTDLDARMRNLEAQHTFGFSQVQAQTRSLALQLEQQRQLVDHMRSQHRHGIEKRLKALEDGVFKASH